MIDRTFSLFFRRISICPDGDESHRVLLAAEFQLRSSRENANSTQAAEVSVEACYRERNLGRIETEKGEWLIAREG